MGGILLCYNHAAQKDDVTRIIRVNNDTPYLVKAFLVVDGIYDDILAVVRGYLADTNRDLPIGVQRASIPPHKQFIFPADGSSCTQYIFRANAVTTAVLLHGALLTPETQHLFDVYTLLPDLTLPRLLQWDE